MKSFRLIAAAIVVLMLGALMSLVGAPPAHAQAPSGNEYHIPPRFVADPGPEAAPCPAGSSVLYEVDADGLTVGDIIIRYCTLEAASASSGFVLVTTEADCAEARTYGVDNGSGTLLFDRGNWIPEVGLCWGGGNVGTELTAELCQGSIFASGIAFGPGTTNTCMIPIYKAAPPDFVPPEDLATLWELDGTTATIELLPAFIDQLEADGWILITTNPVVYNGPVPADGILRFTIPAGFEDAQYTVRATTKAGTQATLTFSFNDAIPARPSTPSATRAVLPPPPPPELDLALTDPYECGGGFTGHITDGTPPYTISYRIESNFYSADLGSFASDTGQFSTPDGYLDYSQIPDAWYSVSISIADSAQWTRTLSLIGFATERLTQDCGEAPAAAAAVPAAQPADDEQPVGLAVTGTTTDMAMLVSQLLLGLGLSTLAMLRLAHIRRSDDE